MLTILVLEVCNLNVGVRNLSIKEPIVECWFFVFQVTVRNLSSLYWNQLHYRVFLSE
jgi:hypothetical protein